MGLAAFNRARRLAAEKSEQEEVKAEDGTQSEGEETNPSEEVPQKAEERKKKPGRPKKQR